MSKPDDPIDLAALQADDDLIEELRAGAEPPSDNQIAQHLAAMRDHAQGTT